MHALWLVAICFLLQVVKPLRDKKVRTSASEEDTAGELGVVNPVQGFKGAIDFGQENGSWSVNEKLGGESKDEHDLEGKNIAEPGIDEAKKNSKKEKPAKKAAKKAEKRQKKLEKKKKKKQQKEQKEQTRNQNTKKDIIK